MIAAVAPREIDGPLGVAVGVARAEVGENWREDCPACGHPFPGSHVEVYPGAGTPAMILCLVPMNGTRCYARCGACRRDLP